MGIKFARRMDNLKGSAIRELLKYAEQPDIISFAGGLPAPELFPVKEMEEACKRVLEEDGKASMQYGATDGYLPLREKIAKRSAKLGFIPDPNEILITAGSQQGLDFSAKIFINEGDVIITESPSYLGALNAFKAYQPKFVEIPMDEEGMIIEELEKALKANSNIKFIYTIPDFQNPTGRSMPVERRKRLMELATEYEIPVIEDNPYGELRFEGQILPSLKCFDPKNLVIMLGTFSKILAPGMRLGWVVAAPEILKKYNIAKQGADLQCSSMAQREVNMFMEMYDLEEHIAKIIKVYGERKDLMLDTIKKEFPSDVTCTNPVGGLFAWATFPEGIDASVLLQKVLQQKVAFVPGEPFYPNGGNANHCRLNYSCMSEDKIVEGITRLGKALKSM
ncbi:MAG: PLP-dependent aminotransferase family protein [Clostridiaceae bacterium]|jgi:DNA-binding transcriptional MocR family regulator|nr:PLP-dependent aminotransferase family protein [Clostridiaceae bacterium]